MIFQIKILALTPWRQRSLKVFTGRRRRRDYLRLSRPWGPFGFVGKRKHWTLCDADSNSEQVSYVWLVLQERHGIFCTPRSTCWTLLGLRLFYGILRLLQTCWRREVKHSKQILKPLSKVNRPHTHTRTHTRRQQWFIVTHTCSHEPMTTLHFLFSLWSVWNNLLVYRRSSWTRSRCDINTKLTLCWFIRKSDFRKTTWMNREARQEKRFNRDN